MPKNYTGLAKNRSFVDLQLSVSLHVAFNVTVLLMQFSKGSSPWYTVLLRSVEIFPRTYKKEKLNTKNLHFGVSSHTILHITWYIDIHGTITLQYEHIKKHFGYEVMLHYAGNLTVPASISHYRICLFILVSTKWAFWGVETFYPSLAQGNRCTKIFKNLLMLPHFPFPPYNR